MLKEAKPDVLIAVGPDGTHCGHAVAGLEAGCDVIVEKPMVIDCEQVRRLQTAEKRSGRKVRVAFNYRYTPTHKTLKRMIQDGKLGRIVNVEFTYNLDTWHGSSYFYRWNRDRRVSGGLNIHKCCHHFDLINWFLDDAPVEVFSFGGLNYYGPDGVLRPRDGQGRPLSPADEKRRCPIFQKFYAGKWSPESNAIGTGWDTFELPMDVQYPPEKPRYIYDDEIVIEDTYNAVVRYERGATMSYACNFCTPWEGYALGLNGTAGRVEIVHRSDPDPTGKTNPAPETGQIVFYPLFGGKEIIEVPPVAGGHGGADFRIQSDLIDGPCAESEELRLVAGSRAGAHAVAIGEAVARSIRSHQPVSLPALLEGRPDAS
jgi:predicted dehydrogenase